MSKFKVGDKVICVSSDGWDFLKINEEYVVIEVDDKGVIIDDLPKFVHLEKRFKIKEESHDV